jgi:5-methylthioadenosine/S-adenosylhomocysteine deaminase
MHAAHGLLRCICPDKIDWDETISLFLTNYWNKVRDKHELAGCTLAALELIRSGTTCFLEPGTVFEPANLVEAAQSIGIRAFVADGFILDRGAKVSGALKVQRAPRNTKEAIDRIGRQLALNKDQEGTVHGCVALAGSGTASDELVMYAKHCANQGSAVLTAHQSWHRNDHEADERRFGCSPVKHYDEKGVLDRSTLLSQLNFATDDDIARLARCGTSVAWAPVVAGIWGTGGGKSRHAELFRRGCNVSLASDGTILGISVDLANAARQAVVLSREDGLGNNALIAEDTLEMMTIGGAKALGMEHELGSLEPGKRADLVIRRKDLAELYPHGHLVAQLIYAARSRGVDTVLVNGRIVLQHGRFLSVDEQQLRESAMTTAKELMKELNWKIQSKWPLVSDSPLP